MTYADATFQFLWSAVPSPSVNAPAAVVFESVAAEVFGTKQRRFGPMPSPETQVSVRDVLRADGPVRFFAPWGSSKQTAGAPLDVLEFMALRQLACVRDGLARFGRASEFSFRVEDLTDRYLFGTQRADQIAEYADRFGNLARLILPGSRPVLESQVMTYGDFRAMADDFAPIFYNYLRGDFSADRLAVIGWTGTIPAEQLAYYTAAYAVFYPGDDPKWHASRYFAATLARTKLKGTATPTVPFLTATFTHPVPGNPVNRPRIHYRTLADRYTHQHKSPWLAAGYLEIGEDGSVTSKFVGPDTGELVPQAIEFGGVPVYAPCLPK
jgi:hypothetical protein